MKTFLSSFISSLTPYTAGEQPQDRRYVKLNTNENPYPPSPKAAEALRTFDVDRLRLYPSPDADGLRDAGAEVTDVAAYCLKKAGMGNGLLHMMLSIKRKHMDCMAFTSPMSAQSFFDDIRDFFGQEDADRYMRENVKVAAIGRPTAMKLESLGRKPDIVPERTTFHDMLEAIKAEFE